MSSPRRLLAPECDVQRLPQPSSAFFGLYERGDAWSSTSTPCTTSTTPNFLPFKVCQTRAEDRRRSIVGLGPRGECTMSSDCVPPYCLP